MNNLELIINGVCLGIFITLTLLALFLWGCAIHYKDSDRYFKVIMMVYFLLSFTLVLVYRIGVKFL